MAAATGIDKAPTGLPKQYRDAWNAAVETLKEHKLWSAAQRPLLEDYVMALLLRDQHRTAAMADDFQFSEKTERHFIHPGFASADKEARRALALADALGLTHRGRKALVGPVKQEGKTDDGTNDDGGFDELDEVAQRRAARSA